MVSEASHPILTYNFCMRAFLLLLLGITVPWLAACQAAPGADSQLETSQPTETPTITSTSVTSAPVSTRTPPQSTPPPDASPTAIILLPTASTSLQVCSPLGEHGLEELAEIVSQPYDPPPPGKDDRHHGVDFAYYRHAGRTSIEGEQIKAILPGRVVAIMDDRLPYGNMVMLETRLEQMPAELIAALSMHNHTSLYHLYAHLESAPEVILDQEVACGQALGQVGQTGYFVPVPHLHLETRNGPPGARFESMAFYDTQASEEERSLYRLWRTSGTFEHFDPMILVESVLSLLPSDQPQ